MSTAMSNNVQSRRDFLAAAAGTAAVGVVVPYFLTGQKVVADELKAKSKSDRLSVGAIGVGGRGTGIADHASAHGDVVAVCDVDRQHAERAREKLSGGKAYVYGDYREVLDRKDIEVVTIGTPDHWHTKIAIEAMQAGKDVYCEKPLTLTVDEGKLICQTVQSTGRVFQVGTQQRSEYEGRFLMAVALCQHGRLGKIKRLTCSIGAGADGGPFAESEPPSHLDWETWLGQAPLVPYVKERCHYQFRWWHAYSGGNMTDWGAHHVDIAQWAIGASDTGPVSISGEATHPNVANGYNTAVTFNITCKFDSGAEIVIRDKTPTLDNGIFIEGEKGRIVVTRGKLTGRPVEELKENPLPEGAITKLYKGKKPGSHMGNFFECVKTREQPVSDVFSHHRALTTCHLANISIRLGRPLTWDPVSEQIVADGEANAWLKRGQRKGYEIVA